LIRRRFILGGLFLLLFGLGWWVGRGGASADLYANVDLFVEVLHRVEDNYVDRVEPEKLVRGALKGMLRDLDPYSQFLDRRSYGDLQSVTEGHFGGIGVVVSVRDNYPTVISPIEGSPAWEAGMRSGDVIVKIEGQSTEGFTVEDAATHLRGPQGTRVAISVRREGDPEEHPYTLERRVIETRSVPYAFVVGKDVGYLRLSNFSEKSGAEVRAAATRLGTEGARGMVLDLRSNPGGLLEQAVDVAEQFLPRGSLVVYTRGRSSPQDTRYYAAEARPNLGGPLVVLVDGGTASASEIVAGALQDLDRALVLGRTSFGKGSVQSVYPLSGRTEALKLTTALYYTPSGRSIHRFTHAVSDDDDEGDGTPADTTAPPDTVPRPRFKTAAGRVVFGGGGITPDLTVLADSLPPLSLKLEQRGLPFRFANRWVNTHPEAKLPARLGDDVWREFLTFARAEKIAVGDSAAAAERPRIESAVRREMARRLGGDAAAARVALENDPVFRRAVEVLARARAARDVFAAAGVPAPTRTARR
jgi:carboxyl-terminal processing protease